jgi:hypothetical protein
MHEETCARITSANVLTSLCFTCFILQNGGNEAAIIWDYFVAECSDVSMLASMCFVASRPLELQGGRQRRGRKALGVGLTS